VAAFALDQDGAAGSRQALQEAKQALHHRTFPEQLAKAIARFDGLAQVAVFAAQVPFGQGLVHQGADLGQLHGFGHKMIGARLDRLHRDIDAAKGRHQHHLGLRASDVDLAHQRQAVHAPHAQIGQDHIKVVLFQELQGGFAARCGVNLVPFARQVVAQERQHPDFVIHH
jgi:hypothetical protein